MKPPPEEKLLRLIRGKAAKPAAEAPVPAAMLPTTPGPGAPRRWHALPWPTLAVGALGALLGLEAFCLLLQAVWPLPAVTPPSAATARPRTDDPAASDAEVAELPTLAASATRSLFSPASPGAPAYVPPSTSATSLHTRLTLMGIVAGDPAQAIIEDSQTKKTYFVTSGQAVVEGAVVEEVRENGVVLNLAGERIELTL